MGWKLSKLVQSITRNWVGLQFFKNRHMRVLERPVSAAPPSYKTPPNQVTVPPNPNFSKESDSSMQSSSSCESKPESFTEKIYGCICNGYTLINRTRPCNYNSLASSIGPVLSVNGVWPSVALTLGVTKRCPSNWVIKSPKWQTMAGWGVSLCKT